MLAFYLTLIQGEEDKLKFTDIFENYRYLMLHIAVKIINDSWLAEDAVSESFLKIIGYLHKLGGVGSYKTKGFVIIVVRTTSIDFYNKRKKLNAYEVLADNIESIITKVDVDLSAPTNSVILELASYIKELNITVRDTFVLYAVYEHSYSEIAKIQNITIENVRRRISRARSLVRERYSEEGTG